MDTYLKNYWSLYLDFLDDFKDLNYKGFSLPYLCHFRSLERFIDPLLYDEDFSKQLNHSVNERREVQEKFNTFIQSNTGKKAVENSNGMVVFHDVYGLLRFTENNVKDYCNPAKSMRISEGKKKPGSAELLNGLPVEYFNKYAIDTKKAVAEIHNQARSVFNKHKSHPLYSNAKFQAYLFKQLFRIIKRVEEADNFLSKVNVSCVVVASTHYYQSRTFAMVAARKGIPTICMQHGIIGREIGYLPRIATIDAVYGQFEIDWYKQLGENENSLEIIGHPRFDQAFKRSSVTRAKFNKEIGLDSSRKTLMIVVRGKRDIDRWKQIIDAISKKVDLNIVIKDFPPQNTHALSKMYPFVYTSQDYNLYDILSNVDAVVAYPSTVGLEAMIAKKTVFILNAGFSGDTGYFNRLDEMIQTDPNNLAQMIIRYFTNSDFKNNADKKREEFMLHAYPSKTLSGKRLKKLINKLTK